MPHNAVVTGGAGFIGVNLAAALAKAGCDVTLYDNLSRRGSRANWKWLQGAAPSVNLVEMDLADHHEFRRMTRLLNGVDVVYHLAAQTAVTSSVADPWRDFQTNVTGTVALLEAVRVQKFPPVLIFASTNKVYGDLAHLRINDDGGRYAFEDYPQGIPETMRLDFKTPYGCSKGTADAYVLEYGRSFEIPVVVFRQSCIYGPHQHGTSDQGWLSHFLTSIVEGTEITIYGDGRQVRDILYIDDLVRAFELALTNIELTRGKAYNIGGGPKFSGSIAFDFLPMLARALEHSAESLCKGDWRPHDQKVYISDIRKAQRDMGWTPQIEPEVGIRSLVESFFAIPI